MPHESIILTGRSKIKSNVFRLSNEVMNLPNSSNDIFSEILKWISLFICLKCKSESIIKNEPCNLSAMI
jgi:hypothetical protein